MIGVQKKSTPKVEVVGEPVEAEVMPPRHNSEIEFLELARRVGRSLIFVTDGRCRRKATVADRDRERRKWAGKRALPSDTYRASARRGNSLRCSVRWPKRRLLVRHARLSQRFDSLPRRLQGRRRRRASCPPVGNCPYLGSW